MGRYIGYARVSRDDQNLELQIEALRSAGCEEEWIFTDQISGSKSIRPVLEECLKELQAGDITLAYKSCALLIDCLK